MFYLLSQQLLDWAKGTPWADHLSALRLFRYITVRSAGAAITALVLSWWLGPKIIHWLKQQKFGQDYADKAEEAGGLAARVLSKKGTPTMGGILIVAVLFFSTMLWAQLDNKLVLLTLLSVIVLAGLGFYDDYAKIIQQSGGGTPPRVKLWAQMAVSLFIGVYLWETPSTSKLVTEITVPFYKYPVAKHAAWLGILIVVLAIVGASNAVNLTDGLDGLAIGCSLIVAFVFLVFTYRGGQHQGRGLFADSLRERRGRIDGVLRGAPRRGPGFLWFNCHPAQVFMGDTGSLAIGGSLGIVAVLIHQPFVLVIAGGVFVMEAVSVMLQTGWFRFTRMRYGTGRRIFLMAPLHHHFEKKGWYESQVVMRFYILCVLFAVIALSTLKLR